MTGSDAKSESEIPPEHSYVFFGNGEAHLLAADGPICGVPLDREYRTGNDPGDAFDICPECTSQSPDASKSDVVEFLEREIPGFEKSNHTMSYFTNEQLSALANEIIRLRDGAKEECS